MACLDEELHICVHKGYSHCHCRAVWEHEVGVLAELLDDAEDVVPPSTVETGAVIS